MGWEIGYDDIMTFDDYKEKRNHYKARNKQTYWKPLIKFRGEK